jgi:putative nucleotidyltransferase with HDIG domain
MPAGRTLRLPPHLTGVISEISACLAAGGVQAYLTGGSIRDILIGRSVADLDISIDDDPPEAGPRLAEALGGIYFPLDLERRHARVLLPSDLPHVDLLPLRGLIEDDLRLRDFTIGALAVELPQLASGVARLIDPNNGGADIESRIIRSLSEQALMDDPLRLLRGVRLAVQLGFEVEPNTLSLIRRHARLIQGCAPERQRDEIMLILATDHAAGGLRLLEAMGLLAAALPELDVMRGVGQPKEHYWDVFGHSIEAVAALDWLMLESPPVPAPQAALWDELWTGFSWWPHARDRWRDALAPGCSRLATLKLTALLHDIGKPATRSIEPGGRARFFGHSAAGADIARSLLERLRCPARIVAHVSTMIDAHLRPLLMAMEGPPTRRAVNRFFRDTGDAGPDTLFLSLADHLATSGPRVTLDGWRRHVAVVSSILATSLEQPVATASSKLVSGDDLMMEFGLEPGLVVGELLEFIAEAHRAGEVTTKEEALEIARRHLT